jgi:hypothetical protein
MRKQQADHRATNFDTEQVSIYRQIQEENKRKEAQIKSDAEAAARLQREEREREAREKLKANAAAETRAQNQERERRARAKAERQTRSEREKSEREEAQRKEAAAKRNEEMRRKAFGPGSKPATQPRAEAPARRNTEPARAGQDQRARPHLKPPVPAPLTAANLQAQKDDYHTPQAKSELNRPAGDSTRTIIPSMMTKEEYAQWEAELERKNAERAKQGLPPLIGS